MVVFRFLIASLNMDAVLAEATIHQRRQALHRMTKGLGLQQASQWANPGFKFLSPAQTRPKPWRVRPEPDPTQKNPGHPKQPKLFRAGINPILFKDVS